MYLAIRDFNVEEREPTFTSEDIRLLSFKVGDIILVTLTINSNGWFEGYRHSDSDRLCGIAHKSMIRRILYK